MTQSEPLLNENEAGGGESSAQQSMKEECSLNELLKKLRLLRIDCVLLHNSIEKSLLSSGVCKRYTQGVGRRGRARETAATAPSAQSSTIVINGTVYNKAPKPPQSSSSSSYSSSSRVSQRIQTRTSRYHSNCSTPTFGTPIKSILRRRISPATSPPWRYSSASSTRSSTPSASTLTSRRHSNGTRKKKSRWYPRTTSPEPFQMTIREATQPHRLSYSEKFLYKMLEEKRMKEENEILQSQKKFHAHPIPMTTYVPESSFYIGKLKRIKSLTPSSRRTKQGMKDTSKTKESTTKNKFHHTPIPLSTFIRPATSLDDLRKLRRHQRAIDLLVESSEPAGMSDHSIRWHIRNRIRHNPKCFESKSSKEYRMRKRYSKSMPDFHKLQLEFRDQLARVAVVKPTTTPEPFAFEAETPAHHCWAKIETRYEARLAHQIHHFYFKLTFDFLQNWTEAMDVELKKLKKVFEEYKKS